MAVLPEADITTLEAAPAAALLVVFGAKALERTVVFGLNAADHVVQWVKYGRSTDPHTWPGWEDAGVEPPSIEQKIENLLGADAMRQIREDSRLPAGATHADHLVNMYGEGADQCPFLNGQLELRS